jgi:hypothetical protein
VPAAVTQQTVTSSCHHPHCGRQPRLERNNSGGALLCPQRLGCCAMQLHTRLNSMQPLHIALGEERVEL